jgi:hypothetical protein
MISTPPPVTSLSIGVSGTIIGDFPGTTAWYPGTVTKAPWGEFGNDPIAPGTSQSYSVTFTNTGTAPERFGVKETPDYGTSVPGPTVPASWVTYSEPANVSILKPGQAVIVAVKVTVPAKATRELYTGALMATASAVTPLPGKTNVVVGAGEAEFIRVGTPAKPLPGTGTS